MISAAEPSARRRLAPGVELGLLLLVGCGVVAVAHISGGTSGALTEPLRLQGRAFGTTWHVAVAGPAPAPRERLQAALEAELERLDAVFSVWRDDSELAGLNAHGAGAPLPVSRELIDVLARAARIHRASGGAFDPSVGPLVRLWGFGPDARHPEPPAADRLAAARLRVGFDQLELDLAAGTVVKARADLELGLDAIAKGHAVDALSALLLRHGASNHIVEIGGEVRAQGMAAPGQRWRVGIQTPEPGSAVAACLALPLRDRAVATSGDYRNYRELDGRRISHTIDPTTGAPVTHRLASVSVVAPTCAAADGWATALSVLGMRRGLEVAEREGLAALFIVRRDEGGFEQQTTPAFDALTELAP